ncbi:MAG: NAD kinase [Flavobacteriales bacterium]|jgi:NAD+ kinase
MNICVYGKKFDPQYAAEVVTLLDNLIGRGARLRVYDRFYRFLTEHTSIRRDLAVFTRDEDLRGSEFVVSIGGDGTLLDCARIVGGLEIPVLGINTGRLGFLSTVGLPESQAAIEAIYAGSYHVDRRSMIQVACNQVDLGERPYALNEVSILNKDRNSMVRIHTHVNGIFMNTYWADGLIVSTPTGSTAYSLSCGGPIVTPDSETFVLTPIAAHNLTVRPVIISDRHTITLRAEGRSPSFLLTMDSGHVQIGPDATIELSLAPFRFHLVSLGGADFFQTIRSKMGWGADKRN